MATRSTVTGAPASAAAATMAATASAEQRDRRDAVADAIGLEDRAERRRDDDAEAIFGQRPHRMFAAGPATEIRAGDQDVRAGIARLVEHERRIGHAAAVA